ncbi:hypothetical protein NPIL_163071 [Nephila pilipes]|uniref:Uncharacterized protein n=1 Tax=Nephila pilipes TaxID=299642 RepID=A0A8X6QCU8_NEPPI|nr:hypothetical protein NPIL_163071 [Nephila pilipes]
MRRDNDGVFPQVPAEIPNIKIIVINHWLPRNQSVNDRRYLWLSTVAGAKPAASSMQSSFAKFFSFERLVVYLVGTLSAPPIHKIKGTRNPLGTECNDLEGIRVHFFYSSSLCVFIKASNFQSRILKCIPFAFKIFRNVFGIE